MLVGKILVLVFVIKYLKNSNIFLRMIKYIHLANFKASLKYSLTTKKQKGSSSSSPKQKILEGTKKIFKQTSTPQAGSLVISTFFRRTKTPTSISPMV